MLNKSIIQFFFDGCVQGQEQGHRNPSKTVGAEAAVRRYLTSQGKEKPQEDGKCWSAGCVALERL